MTVDHDVAPERRINKRLEKDLEQVRRDCLDEKRTHLRAGTWRGLDGAAVALLGHLRDLHGTACKCCPRRTS
jgi:hypothetical protein